MVHRPLRRMLFLALSLVLIWGFSDLADARDLHAIKIAGGGQVLLEADGTVWFQDTKVTPNEWRMVEGLKDIVTIGGPPDEGVALDKAGHLHFWVQACTLEKILVCDVNTTRSVSGTYTQLVNDDSNLIAMLRVDQAVVVTSLGFGYEHPPAVLSFPEPVIALSITDSHVLVRLQSGALQDCKTNVGDYSEFINNKTKLELTCHRAKELEDFSVVGAIAWGGFIGLTKAGDVVKISKKRTNLLKAPFPDFFKVQRSSAIHIKQRFINVVDMLYWADEEHQRRKNVKIAVPNGFGDIVDASSSLDSVVGVLGSSGKILRFWNRGLSIEEAAIPTSP